MAWLIKNPGKDLGSVQVDKKWRSLSPGESITVSSKPTGRTYGIKVVEFSEAVKPKSPVAPSSPPSPAPVAGALPKDNSGGNK